MAETRLPVEHLFTLTATTERVTTLVGAPQGTRRIVNVPAGSFEGPRLKGTIKAPAGDWVTMRSDGSALLDVRLLLQTDDGADILVQYRGVLTEDGAKIRTALLFETGDERYSWLNDAQAVGLGVRGDGQVTYDVYQLL